VSADEEEADLPTRSALSRARKGEEKRLAALATALVGLSNKQLGKLELDEEIVDAVEEARRMKAHAARARQLRVVRRSLRGSDSQAIADAVDELINPSGLITPAAREARRWVERFLGDGNQAVEDFVANYAQADRQRLKGLVRNLRKADASKVAKPRAKLVAAVLALVQEADSTAIH